MTKVPASPYRNGYNSIIPSSDPDNMLMEFGVIMQEKSQVDICYSPTKEIAVVLLTGEVEFFYDGNRLVASRNDIFTQNPPVMHIPYDVKVKITCRSEKSELAVIKTDNVFKFEPKLYTPEMTVVDHRGAGILDDTAARYVRTTITDEISPDSNLVLGEVITPGGKWSSYPPHFHPQPEIYYYRFNQPNGYGICQLGDKAELVYDSDTIKIINNDTHPQTAAPGYSMYYLWVIRHLGDDRYITPTNDPRHEHLLTPPVKPAAPTPPPTRAAKPKTTGSSIPTTAPRR